MVAYRTFKEIHALLIKGNFEGARRILMELQARYIALCDEVGVLKMQVQEFEDILFLSQNLITERGQYWLRMGDIKHGPFCKPCYEYTGKLIRLENHKNTWRCSYCGLLYDREQSLQAASPTANSFVRQGKIIPFRFPVQQC
ncbi:MAG: hypothetical protein FWG59_07510 [Betaproteobacteria bacterium]|nr:hypothetical protein [Betaproteobacteria bacterium]